MTTLEIAAAVIVGIVSAARLTRLSTQDSFPPAVWWRMKWETLTADGPWSPLAFCHWCVAPWMTLLVLVTGLLSEFHVAWWFVNGWLAASYVASMIVERDEKD